MDVLLNILEEAPAKEAQSLKSLDTHMTCEVCGNTCHSENNCPKTHLKEASFVNTRGLQ
ncbi:hypothetical protein Zm00014a_025177 [Zea mays]|uniref:Uncharacterized protein n=1 Tax=Zea mays TaxID=4577 RepID=A0A3L6FMC8_MAIZE|nr:hypothetical protein Zm00014a_025177 [Zea mays]